MTRCERAAHVVLLDDDPQVRRMVERYLVAEGLRVSAVADAAAFWALCETDPPDLALLDIRLPGEDGLSVARRLRERFEPGIIILSSRGDTADRVVGLEVGADDYLAKPFELRELLARIRSVLRRTSVTPVTAPAAPRHERFEFGDWSLEPSARDLIGGDGNAVVLSSREFELLVLFLRNPRRVLSRDRIMNQIFHRDWEAVDRTVDILVHQLRSKLEPDARNPVLIRTVRGAGYVLSSDVARVTK